MGKITTKKGKVREWNYDDVYHFSEDNRFGREFSENVIKYQILGKQIIKYNRDNLYFLGSSSQLIDHSYVHIRKLQYFTLFDKIHQKQKLLLHCGDTIPNLFDKSIDNWLNNMNLQVKDNPMPVSPGGPRSPKEKSSLLNLQLNSPRGPHSDIILDDHNCLEELLASILHFKYQKKSWRRKFFVLDCLSGVLYDYGYRYLDISRAFLQSAKPNRIFNLSGSFPFFSLPSLSLPYTSSLSLLFLSFSYPVLSSFLSPSPLLLLLFFRFPLFFSFTSSVISHCLCLHSLLFLTFHHPFPKFLTIKGVYLTCQFPISLFLDYLILSFSFPSHCTFIFYYFACLCRSFS